MKNLIKSFCTICLFLCLSSSLKSQATVFELRNDNVNQVAADIITLMNQTFGILYVPTTSELVDFLSVPFANQFYTNNVNNCNPPGFNIINAGGGLGFRFSQLANTYGDLLFMGVMDYSSGAPQNSFAVYGPEVYNGVNFNMAIQHRIYMVGTYCSACTSGIIPQCASNLEIVIIDKHIL